ncbi:hypothetical protein GH741_11315 [Aquibacillus halophilus]|uniref:Uncharacterized protein n=1 Tax=Aquibacillus halophilus TaxID=930132 RepID=A0A6A8DHF2_9BACI|nr:hypothetical protein [Aquibacillus halophilus]MRH43269.1 hypothetical protein [Aquibacillus halophilus]
MTEENFHRFVTVGSTLTVIGFILLFFSTHFGTSMADSWLMNQGGADTSIYQIRVESYINNFLVSGGILFGIGLFTLILTYFIKMNFTKE